MLICLVYALLGFCIYKFVVYPLYLSPLAKIPNAHPLSPLTSLWIHWKRFRMQEVEVVYKALQCKGPVVRLGPKELLVNTVDGGIRTIHGVGSEKTPWYEFSMNNGMRNMFSSLSPGDHARRRRRFANIYSKSSIQRSPHVSNIMSILLLKRYIPIISDSVRQSTTFNLLNLNFAYGQDFINAFFFGISRGTNFIQNIDARDRWLDLYLQAHPEDLSFWSLEVPNVTKWFARIAIQIMPDWYAEARRNLDAWVLEMVDAAEDAIVTQSAKDMHVGDFPVVYNQLRQALLIEQRGKYVGNSTRLSPQQSLELASECLDHIYATRDTFGITLTFLIYHLSLQPKLQHSLRQELRSIPHSFRFPSSPEEETTELLLPSPHSLERLPLLQAVIKEALRLRNTAPTSSSRFTPAKRKATTIGPYEGIPSGVRTDCFAWFLHRNEAIYPDPEEFLPARWLDDGSSSPGREEEEKEREKWFWAWGSGSRACIGQHLALEMMRYATAAIFTNFSSNVVSDEGFGRDGAFVTGATGDGLFLRFERVEEVGEEEGGDGIR